jgi:acyl-CoA thioesterase
MSFIDETRLSAVGATTFAATLTPEWRSMLGIHGGYVAAVAARAIELAVDDPSRALRSFTAQFIRPAHPGPVAIDVHFAKTGRSASFVTAHVTQDERPVVTATAIAATSRGGLEFAEIVPPVNALMAPPADAEQFFGADPGTHFAQLDLRLAPGLTMFGAHSRAYVAGWIRPLDPNEPVTVPWIVCATDFMPPSMVFRTNRPVQAATIDMAIQLTSSNPAKAVGAGGHVYAELSCAISAEGFSVEDGSFWSSSGQLVATARQVRLSGT